MAYGQMHPVTQGAKLYVCWQTDMASYKNVSYVD